MIKYICPADLPLLEALVLLFPDSSKTSLRSWIKNGRISVDDIPAKLQQQSVAKGQTIVLSERPHYVKENVRILYADRHLVVIDKPEGLLSVSTDFETTLTAFALLKEKYYPRPVYVVHRLDQDTSGVMLFALSEKALEGLKMTFAAHDITREYAAIVQGRMPQQSGTWQSYLFENARYIVKPTTDPSKGELAITHFTVVKSNRGYSRLDLTLETGKKNQIRVHCQQAGHSVVGDKKYGARTNPIKRLALHAHRLAFFHPITGKPMDFVSPIPESFFRLVK